MMRWIVLILLFFWMGVGNHVLAQSDTTEVVVDTTYYKSRLNGQFKPVEKSKGATHFSVDIYERGQRVERTFAALNANEVVYRKQWEDDRPTGVWEFYGTQGRLINRYNFGKLEYGPCDIKDSVPPEGLVLPKFGSGVDELMRYCGENITYPEESRANGVTGTVYIYFQIDETGHPQELMICDKGLDPYCDLVVWELVESMPVWKPAEYDGEKITAAYILPIRFSLR